MQQLNSKSLKVVFLNDHKILNQRYRTSLMTLASDRGYSVRSLGILDGKSLLSIIAIFIPGIFLGTIVSSNLRTNILVLLMWHIRGVVILNGLGRHRNSTSFRKLLIILVQLNRRKSIAVQSYADFRYFRRFTNSPAVFWVPGSGGSAKKTSELKNLFCVQRNDKLPLVADSIRQLLQTGSMAGQLSIVGCDTSDEAVALFSPHSVTFTGYLPSADILTTGGVFVQPSGYGEGFPHTLADAIVSKIEIVIPRREYVRYGLHKLQAKSTPIANGWVRLTITEQLVTAVSEDRVNNSYAELLSRA